MDKERDYIQDLAEIRSMMERSSKFLSLSGLSGIIAGTYALAGAYIAYNVYGFNPDKIAYRAMPSANLTAVVGLAVVILILTLATAVFLSRKKAKKRGEKAWNATSQRMLLHLAVPLTAGGILLLILLSKGLIGLLAPFTLLFYGLAMYNASTFTYEDMRYLGLIQIGLGLISSWYVEYGLLFWAMGFGAVHIFYGVYMHVKYER